jgi:hypothetical protein
MLAALTVAYISIVTSMKAHALTTSAPGREEAMTIGSNGISTTDGDYTLDTSYTQERALHKIQVILEIQVVISI